VCFAATHPPTRDCPWSGYSPPSLSFLGCSNPKNTSSEKGGREKSNDTSGYTGNASTPASGSALARACTHAIDTVTHDKHARLLRSAHVGRGGRGGYCGGHALLLARSAAFRHTGTRLTARLQQLWHLLGGGVVEIHAFIHCRMREGQGERCCF
jgi:hypothetical protein